jgi:endonuclease/exonuclease/phosphatase (EEP) superfamily protein YafD
VRLKCLFWNINKNAIPGFVRQLALEEGADLVILAECAMPPARVLEELNDQSPDYQYAWGNCGHLTFFTRFEAERLTPLLESSRVSIRRLSLADCKPILVAAAHLPSKIGNSDESQILESAHLSRMIADVEAREGHQRTMLLGDLNMNPFEAGMVGARGGLHAVMSRQIAQRQTRRVQRERYPFFYNPMWNFLGDRAETSGTFYFENAEPVCYFWNMFDQVLLRPELLEGFEPEQVRILREVRGMSLLQNGRVDKDMCSDHLPVSVELTLEGIKHA